MKFTNDLWDIIGEFHKYYLEKVDRNELSKSVNLATTNDKTNLNKKCSFCFSKFGKSFPHSLKNCNNLKAASPEDRAKYASTYEGKTLPTALKVLMVTDNKTTSPSSPAPPCNNICWSKNFVFRIFRNGHWG